MKAVKKSIWVGDSLEALKQFPEEVQDSMGYLLHKVQEGITPRGVKHLKRFKPAVMEIISNYDSNTYRVMYSVKIDEAVYVLHCFQKKSKKGIKTPKPVIDLVKKRLQEAILISQSKRGV